MTNFEWVRSLSLGELAKLFANTLSAANVLCVTIAILAIMVWLNG